jgi:hypothetical protein
VLLRHSPCGLTVQPSDGGTLPAINDSQVDSMPCGPVAVLMSSHPVLESMNLS